MLIGQTFSLKWNHAFFRQLLTDIKDCLKSQMLQTLLSLDCTVWLESTVCLINYKNLYEKLDTAMRKGDMDISV